MPHLANFLVRGISGATMELVPGADHLLNLSAPNAFDAALHRILTSAVLDPG
jgi:pimeloyl-ACP methyl ester carboxylesterase